MKRSQQSGQRIGQRGIALISVIGLMLVLLVFAGGMVAQLASEVNNVRYETISNRALAAADAGVHSMVEQIQTDTALNLPPPSVPVTYTYPEPSGTPLAASYSAQIDGQWQAGGNNYYLITSTGFFNNGLEHRQRTVRAIAKSIPISSFASFSNYEVNKYGKPVWYLPSQFFDGPVYSGGPMRIAYNSTGTPSPIFGAKVETLNTPVWNPGAPGTPTDWAAVIQGGQPNFAIDKNALSLPQPSDNLYVASEAWEGDGANTTSFPSVPAPGVYMDGSTSKGADAATSSQPVLTTGIYVDAGGNGVTITSSSSGSVEHFTISGTGGNFAKGKYLVDISYGSTPCTGTTTVTQGSSTHTFTGTPCGAPGPGVSNTGNGAIYVTNGNVTLGTGASPDVTLQGQYTIATPDFSPWTNNNITLKGNVSYDPIAASTDKLALWANDVILSTNASNITIDASIIAGFPGEPWNNGNFSNANCGSVGCGTLSQGTLTINGGLIENARGAVGVVLAGKQFGFSRVIKFDSRFANSPPPFNPSTGALSVIAWEDLGF
jgi:hypothetical protein